MRIERKYSYKGVGSGAVRAFYLDVDTDVKPSPAKAIKALIVEEYQAWLKKTAA